MDRVRSTSESHYHAIYPLRQSTNTRPCPPRFAAVSDAGSASSHSLSSLHSFSKSSRDFAEVSLSKVLADYKFIGSVVMFKPEERYGFIRSEQITGDVFFSLNHLLTSDKSVNHVDLIGKAANFTLKDVDGKKSMEARKVDLNASDISVSYVEGRVMDWNDHGCIIQVTSGLGLKNLHNRIFAPILETYNLEMSSDIGSIVTFKIHVDKSFRLEARDVSKARNENFKRGKIRRASTDGSRLLGGENAESLSEGEKLVSFKQLTVDEFSGDLVTEVEAMNVEQLSSLFDQKLKTRLAVLAQQPIGSKLVVSVIKRSARLGGTNVEEKIARMITSNFMVICNSKDGCTVVQAALENFSVTNKVMLAEELLELDSVDQFTDLWVYGSNIFITMLSFLDENSLSTVGLSLAGHYATLSCHIRHYKPVKALMVSLVGTDGFGEIISEVEQELISLAGDKYGHFIVAALIERSPSSIKSRLTSAFTGKLASLSTDQVCHAVIVTAIKESTTSLQAAFIEELCTVSNNQADMAVVKLTKDKFGHLVVLALLEVSRHKQVHNLLKASILCKQDELLENEFAAKIVKAIKLEFHNRLSGNYSKKA